jgi:O-antigen/teichoic acid export membrane protein
VGFYALGMRVLQTPMSLIGGAIAQVFFQRAAEAKFKDDLRPLVENFFKILVILGLFPMMILFIIGKELFIVVFGPDWAISGIYIQILSFWAFFWFISSPLSSIIAILEKQSWGLSLNILILLTRGISLVIGGILGNVLIALTLFSLSGIILYGYLCVKILTYSQISLKESFKIIFSNFLPLIPIGIFLLSLTLIKIGSLMLVFIVCISGVGYYVYKIKNEPLLREFLSKIFKEIGSKI